MATGCSDDASALPERSAGVSRLELFFDLVFVFTVTQLTGVLVDGGDAAALVQVVVMLLLIWWMYDGYAWLTNAIATDRLRFGLLLIGGMGGFLVIALAVPNAYDGDGLVFGLGYLVVVLLHAGMFVRGTSVSEVRAMLRIAPFNLIAVTLVLVGGSLGDDPQWILWALAGILLWFTPRFTTVEGFVVSVSHFVERHGLVVIVALGESIVVIGTGAAELALDPGLVLVALLSLSLSAALWRIYFSDEEAVERALHGMAPQLRAQSALTGFGYWHYGILLGIVARRGRPEQGDRPPLRPAGALDRTEARSRHALFIACDIGFRRTFGIARNRTRLLAAVAALATIPLGSQLAAATQVGAIAALVTAALAAEWILASAPGSSPFLSDSAGHAVRR